LGCTPGVNCTIVIKMHSRPKLYLFIVGAFAICIGVVLIGTPWGLGLYPDSFAYSQAARALAEHGDVMQLPSHWPPLYPILLALAQLLVNDFDLGARLLQGAFMGVNVVLIAMLLKKADQPRVIIATLLILIALQPSFIVLHLLLMSEPAFLSFALLDLLILETLVRRSNSCGLLLLLGLAAGMAIMVRYAGMFLLAVNFIALLFLDQNKRSVAARIPNAIWVSAVALIPISVLALFNIARSGNPVDRLLTWHPLGRQHIRDAITTIGGWFHLSYKPGVLAVVLISAIAVWALRPTKSLSGNEPPILLRLLAIYCFAYAALLVLSISLLDFGIQLGGRTLLPLMPIIPIFLVCATKGITKYRLPLILIGAVALGMALNVHESYSFWRESRVNGTTAAAFGARPITAKTGVCTHPTPGFLLWKPPLLSRTTG
jgi:4-amino-4-deoxy-L-arabinose transferase-like glycosyltransferase